MKVIEEIRAAVDGDGRMVFSFEYFPPEDGGRGGEPLRVHGSHGLRSPAIPPSVTLPGICYCS